MCIDGINSDEAHIKIMMRETERQIKKQLFKCIPLALLSIAAPLTAYFSIFLPDYESPDIRFQRSGSLCVLFAVWMEYHLIKVNEDVNPSGRVTSQQSAVSNKYKGIYRTAQYITVALAVSGTFIWGYGDFFK